MENFSITKNGWTNCILTAGEKSQQPAKQTWNFKFSISVQAFDAVQISAPFVNVLQVTRSKKPQHYFQFKKCKAKIISEIAWNLFIFQLHNIFYPSWIHNMYLCKSKSKLEMLFANIDEHIVELNKRNISSTESTVCMTQIFPNRKINMCI